MPTAAMERNMGEFSGFSSSSPTASRSARDQKRRQRTKAQEEEERETAVREGLVAKAAAMTKIAENMAEQNEMMLAGIQAAARYSNMGMDGDPLTQPDKKVDFVSRNRVNVGPNRDQIDPRARAMMAKAEIMSGATQHLAPGGPGGGGGGGGAPVARQAGRRKRQEEKKPDVSDDL